MESDNSPPTGADLLPVWQWRGLLILLGAVLAVTAGAALWLSLGGADVPPLAPLSWEQVAIGRECLDAAKWRSPGGMPLTIILAARMLPGSEEQTGWGIQRGHGESALRWEVLPPGYYRHAGETRPFHHVSGETDELRLDLTDDSYVLWLNRERAVSGHTPAQDDAAALWSLIGGAGVCWQRLAVFAGDR